MRKKVIIVGFATLTLAGCANDAPVSSRDIGPAEKVNMPDHFATVATKCNHGNRIYQTSHGGNSSSAIAIVPNDESCPQSPR